MNNIIHSALAILFAADNPLQDLYSFDTIWLPSKFMAKAATWTIMEKVTNKVFANIGIAFLLIVTMARFVKLIAEEKNYTIGLIFKNLVPTIIVATILTTPGTWGLICKDTILAAAEALITGVKDACLKETFPNFVSALSASSAANLSFMQHITSLGESSVSIIAFVFTNVLALCIAWAMNLYISLMWSLLFVVGPALLPFVVFSGTANIGWTWLKSFLAFSLMGVIGAIIQGLLFGVGLLTFAGATASEGDVVSGIASSLVFLVCMTMIPSITSQMTGGISSSPMAIASNLIPAARAVLLTGAGAAGMAAGYAAQAGSKIAQNRGNSNLAGALSSLSESAKMQGASTFKRGMKVKL